MSNTRDTKESILNNTAVKVTEKIITKETSDTMKQNSDDDIILATDIIVQLESLQYTEETILRAMLFVCRDTLKKITDVNKQQEWQNRFIEALKTVNKK